MIAPRRAIGSPSAERMVRLGAATGPSERESGAVKTSQSDRQHEEQGRDLDDALDQADARERRLGGGRFLGGRVGGHGASVSMFRPAIKRKSVPGRICSGATPGTGQAPPVISASTISAMAGAVCRP